MMPRCLPKLASFFDRFLMAFCFQIRPLEPQESSPRCSESTIYQKIVFRNLYRFFFNFGANMPPFFFQKPAKNALKLELGRHQFFDGFVHRFFIDVCSILEANLEPCWPLFPQNMGKEFRVYPVFYWVYVLFRNFGRSDVHRAKNVAHHSRLGRVLGSILEGFGLHVGGFC